MCSQQNNIETKIRALEQVLERQPNHPKAVNNIMILLDKFQPRNGGKYVQAAQRLKTISTHNEEISNILRPNALARGFKDWLSCIHELRLIELSPSSQIYSGRKHPLHIGKDVTCRQMMKVFLEENIITSLCFDCYKVQILPRTVVGLMQTHLLLKVMDFKRKNIRKSMIELRPTIQGPYKGYIYCASEEEAIETRDRFHDLLRRYEVADIDVRVSHGCSEFPEKFPDFRYRDDGGHRNFKPPENWREIEKNAYAKLPSEESGIKFDRGHFITLKEVATISNWIGYARMIGDSSVSIFNKLPEMGSPALRQRVALQAKARKAELNGQ